MKNKPFTILTIGRYDVEIKGLDILIDAVKILNNEDPSVNLQCIGFDRDGGSGQMIKYINEHDGSHCVHCLGPKYGEDKEEHIRSANLYCVPSRYESFSYSLIEGLASGLPVLVGSGACITSYFDRDEAESMVVRPAVDSWVDAVRRVKKDSEPCREYAAATYRRFIDEFSASKIGNKVRDLYRVL